MRLQAVQAPQAALTLALLLLVGGSVSSASPKALRSKSAARVKQTPSSKVTPDAASTDEAMVVFGSGRQLSMSAHRRLLDALNGRTAVKVRLPTGEVLDFDNGRESLAGLRAGKYRGADFIVPAETFKADLVSDMIHTESAQRAYLALPDGGRVPYGALVHPSQRTLHHKQGVGPVEPSVPQERLQVVLGGSQRLGIQVHDAILDRHRNWKPVEVGLMTGDQVTVHSYEELLEKLLEPRFLGAKVRLQKNLRVPIDTYRDVVKANERNLVYVIDTRDAEGRGMPYTDYVKQRQRVSKNNAEGTTSEETIDKDTFDGDMEEYDLKKN